MAATLRGPAFRGAPQGEGLESLRGFLEQSPIDQAFGDLHGVQGSALAQVVGDDPEIDAVLDG